VDKATNTIYMKREMENNTFNKIKMILFAIITILFSSCGYKTDYNCSSKYPEIYSVLNRANEITVLEIRNSNQNKCFPAELSKFHNLKSLHFIGNDCDINSPNCKNIDSIPSNIICELSQLEELVLVMNGLERVPECLSQIPTLKRLDLSDNIEISIENVCKISSLEELSLNGCALKQLPREIANLKNLKKIGLSNNNFSDDEKEKVEKMLINVKVYF
jgi:Leucine-rich repeat (LRR) protein